MGGRGHVWKTESAESPNPVPHEEIATLSLPWSPGVEWGCSGRRGAPGFPFLPTPARLRREAGLCSWLPRAEAVPAQRPSPERRGVAHRSPQANFVHFRLSLLC